MAQRAALPGAKASLLSDWAHAVLSGRLFKSFKEIPHGIAPKGETLLLGEGSRNEQEIVNRVLDVGCGRVKAPGSIGVDWNPDATAADVLCDLNRPLPFGDDTFDEVRAVHIIEHLDQVIDTMAELHRVTRPGGSIYLVTPHYSDFASWCDPTHRWHLNTFSFRFFGLVHGQRHWYTRLELRQLALHVTLARPWRLLGIEWLVNRFVWFRRFWEMYLCFMLRGKQMEFTFEVVKSPPPCRDS
jgi:SAM-dependent methyltransferase